MVSFPIPGQTFRSRDGSRWMIDKVIYDPENVHFFEVLLSRIEPHYAHQIAVDAREFSYLVA